MERKKSPPFPAEVRTLTPVVLSFFTNPFCVWGIAVGIAPCLVNVFSGINSNTGVIVNIIWLPVHPVPATDLKLGLDEG